MTGEFQGQDNISALACMYYKAGKCKTLLSPSELLAPLTPWGSVALRNLWQVRLQQWGRKHHNGFSPLKPIS